MIQSPNDASLSLPLPDEDVLDDYIEFVIDNGEDARDRYMTVIVDDQGHAYTLLAGLDRKNVYALLDSFEGRPKSRSGRRIHWSDLPDACQRLMWQEVLNINSQYE